MNLFSFHRAAYPIILLMTPVQQHDYLSVRLDANRYGEALTAIRSVWKRLVPDYPLDYFFLDESFEALHRSDKRLGDIFRYFSATAIIVACMGLFGLAVFTAEQKTKEIGIRKTLGASIISIYLLLSKSFVKWVLLANIIAWPTAFFIMRKWLDNFVYRTTLDLWILIVSGMMALAVSLLTVSYQSIKAARANPVDSLKYE
jgi:ABC-type antimicrobial peptide transport system permease subunit